MNAMVFCWRVSRPWKMVVKFLFLTHNDEDILLFSHQTSSMKYHLTETHEHNFKIHNMVLSSNRYLVKLFKIQQSRDQ